MAEGKKYVQNTVAISLGRAEVVLRALEEYRQKMISEFREDGGDALDDDSLMVFANDLSKVDGIIATIKTAQARIAAKKANKAA